MLTPSDKELDRLSREAAEQFEPDEHISSWERLEPLLDRGIGNKPPISPRRFGRGPIGYSILLMIVAGLSYFFFKQNTHPEAAQKTVSEAKSNSSSSNSPSSKATNKAAKAAATQSGTAEDVSQTNPPPAGAIDTRNDAINKTAPATGSLPDKASVTPADHQNAVQVQTENNATGNSANTGKTNSGKTKSGNHHTAAPVAAAGLTGLDLANSGKNKPLNSSSGKTVAPNRDATNQPGSVDQQHAGIETVPVDAAAALSNPDAALNNGQSANAKGKNAGSVTPGEKDLKSALIPSTALIAGHSDQINDSSLRNYVAPVDSNLTVTDPNKHNSKSLHINKGLKIGLMIAPDVTSVNSVAPEKLSLSGGVTLGYEFLNGLSINTGVIYTNKSYTSNGQDFHHGTIPIAPPYTTPPEYVVGECNMWEIPLTLRYDIQISRKDNFFVNAGMSTYLMRHEDYIAYGHWTNWQGNSLPWDHPFVSEKHSNYFFSIIDLSFGFERQISKVFSLQAEPFFKIPLQGVGWGQVELSSYGVAFSIRYTPVLSKKKKN